MNEQLASELAYAISDRRLGHAYTTPTIGSNYEDWQLIVLDADRRQTTIDQNTINRLMLLLRAGAVVDVEAGVIMAPTRVPGALPEPVRDEQPWPVQPPAIVCRNGHEPTPTGDALNVSISKGSTDAHSTYRAGHVCNVCDAVYTVEYNPAFMRQARRDRAQGIRLSTEGGSGLVVGSCVVDVSQLGE